MKTITFVIVLSLSVLLAMACQPDRELDPRITYTGLYDVVTLTTIQRQVTGKIDTLTGTDIIGVSLGQAPNELRLTLPINLSLTATLTGARFTIPAHAVMVTNADGSVNRGQFQERVGFFASQTISMTSTLQTDIETQTSVATGSKR